MLNIKEIKSIKTPEKSLCDIINTLHKDGPIDSQVMENLTYHKIFHPELFIQYEEKILSALGLFYKITVPNNLYSFMLSSIGNQHKEKYGEYLTPIQASVRNAVEREQYVSISAPTSAGKSFSIRDYIFGLQGDSVIIVPSRALIAEYIKTLRDKFKNDKNIIVSSFVDRVFTDRNLRRIFILTPERSRELFTEKKLNITFFFFDEAQVSEERERGVIFDVLVRRVQKHFPKAKLVFAHPFVNNPEAQFKKHSINEDKSYSRAYPHNTVGKVFVFGNESNNDYYFSPFSEKGHLVKNSIKLNKKFEEFAFDGTKSVLIFVSKSSINNGVFLNDFEKFISDFQFVKNKNALNIISKISDLLGANDSNHRSDLIRLLTKGVVIHHGSVPLDVRFLIEDFIREGYAKICFATSTLAQGINMPFDIVWLTNMRIQGDSEEKKSLAFKNLIGRSGRLSKEANFDYGYVYTKNPKLLSLRVNSEFNLSSDSILEEETENFHDERELVSSIIEGTFDEEINLPTSKVDRLSTDKVSQLISQILKLLYTEKFGEKLFGQTNRNNRDLVKTNLLEIFEISLGRSLYDGEKNVFKSAIEILFHLIQGRSFKEIVGIRYNNIFKGGRNGNAAFTQPANKLPYSKLSNQFPLFPNTKCEDISYDVVAFDTYDYLDTVISFSLSDVFIGAFSIYYCTTKDKKALKMIELLKYGTNNTIYILLIRYGFPPDEVAEISKYVEQISEKNISFKNSITNAPQHIQDLVFWYLP